MRVRALRKGWYASRRIRPGTEFEIAGKHELGAWMERLDKPGPKKKARHAEVGVSPVSDGTDDIRTAQASDS